MQGQIVQVSVSPGGVPKLSLPEGDLQPLGIVGDGHRFPQFHGGPRQAVLLITEEGLEELKEQGFPLYFGALGENLTTRGLDRRHLRLGQRLRVGSEAVIELTKMRVPCKTIQVYGKAIRDAVYDAQVKAGDASSPRWGLGGFYASVVRTGPVRPGDTIVLADHVV